MSMTSEQLQTLADDGFTHVPVMREVLADLDTPVSTYLKLADQAYTYLFESVEGGEKWGRYSIIGLPCKTVVRISGHDVSVYNDGVPGESLNITDPLAWIEEYQSRFKVPDNPDLPRFTGGLVGYFSYDTVRYIEPRLAECPNPDPLKTPDILLMVSEELVVFDNLSGKLILITHVDPADKNAEDIAQERLNLLEQQLQTFVKKARIQASKQTVKEKDFISDFKQKDFEAAVERIKEYIIEGDAMQVVLSQRMSIPFDLPPLDVYRVLRCINPSPYMYFLNLGDFSVVGSSPEILVHLEDGLVTVRPIAGTRPRGTTEVDDLEYERELLNDPKELAEHLMLIDLGRNDVGRIAETGTVKLTERMVIERYSHVMHIVSNVTGKLKKGLSAIDVLRATFPAGTVSGAPKIRAMEIIDELEPVKRGVYSGAVGYIGWNGNMDTAIAIRTAVIKDKKLYIQAGAGIVADSVPENEWKETMNKGRAMFRAVSLASNGL